MKLGSVKNFVSLTDIAKASRDRATRVFLTPLGMPEGEFQVVVGGAAPWKGIKGEALRAQFPRIYNVAKTLAAASKKMAGIVGLAEVNVAGRFKQMPVKAGRAMVAAGKITSADIRPIPRYTLPKVLDLAGYARATGVTVVAV